MVFTAIETPKAIPSDPCKPAATVGTMKKLAASNSTMPPAVSVLFSTATLTGATMVVTAIAAPAAVPLEACIPPARVPITEKSWALTTISPPAVTAELFFMADDVVSTSVLTATEPPRAKVSFPYWTPAAMAPTPVLLSALRVTLPPALTVLLSTVVFTDATMELTAMAAPPALPPETCTTPAKAPPHD